MNNNTIQSLFKKYIDKQPEKYAIREVYFGHIGNLNCNDEVIDDVRYHDELQKIEESKIKLLPLLNEAQIKELDKLIELVEITNIESEVSCYESGFKLGVNLGMDCSKFIKQ